MFAAKQCTQVYCCNNFCVQFVPTHCVLCAGTNTRVWRLWTAADRPALVALATALYRQIADHSLHNFVNVGYCKPAIQGDSDSHSISGPTMRSNRALKLILMPDEGMKYPCILIGTFRTHTDSDTDSERTPITCLIGMIAWCIKPDCVWLCLLQWDQFNTMRSLHSMPAAYQHTAAYCCKPQGYKY